jgi:hypothetical protein
VNTNGNSRVRLRIKSYGKWTDNMNKSKPPNPPGFRVSLHLMENVLMPLVCKLFYPPKENLFTSWQPQSYQTNQQIYIQVSSDFFTKDSISRLHITILDLEMSSTLSFKSFNKHALLMLNKKPD